MMSEDDKALLDKARPLLLQSVDIEGSFLLEQLRCRAALQDQQFEVIDVSI